MATKSWTASRANCTNYRIEFGGTFTVETSKNLSLPLLGGFKCELTISDMVEFNRNSGYNTTVGKKINITCQPKPEDSCILFIVILRSATKKTSRRGTRFMQVDGTAYIEIRNYLEHEFEIELKLVTFTDFLRSNVTEMIVDSDVCDFRILLNQGNDAIGDCDDKKEGPLMLSTSKSLLMSKSEVFKKMLGGEMKEALSNEFDLSDMPRTSVEEMICFINTGLSKYENLALYGEDDEQDAKLTQEAMDTAKLADYYHIDKLKQICSRFLRSRVLIKYAGAFLTLSNRYSIFDLRDRVLRLINANAKEAVGNEPIKNLISKDPELREHIVNALAGIFPDC